MVVETCEFNLSITHQRPILRENTGTKMTQKTKIRRVGGSLALIVPKPMADALAMKEGDEVFLSTGENGLSVSPFDPEFADAMEDAREFMRSHRNAFRELAK